MIKRILFGLICLIASCTPIAALADNGVQVDALWNGMITTSGKPLASGKVYTYTAGTSTPNALYTDVGKTTPASNPIILNSMGKALVYGDGVYKFVIKDANDVTIETRDNLVYQNIDTTSVVNAGATTGSSNAYVATPSPAVAAYTDGLQMFFVANHTNTSTATLNVNGLGAKAIVRANGSALTAGDITSGDLVAVLYVDGSPGKFRILAPLNAFRNNETNSPTVTNTYDLGTSSLKFKDFYLAGTSYANAIKMTAGVISANTSDASDNSFVQIGHADGTRGGFGVFYGNEHASTGGILLESGNVANGNIAITTKNATSQIRLSTANTGRWDVNSSGHLLPVENETYDIGESSGPLSVRNIYAQGVLANRTDGADNDSLTLGHSDSSRGGRVSILGNEFGSSQDGDVGIVSGNVAGSDIHITGTSATSVINLNTGGASQWQIDASGDILPVTDAADEIGTPSAAPLTVHSWRYYIRRSTAASVPTPSTAGTFYLFVNDSDGKLSAKNSSGAVTIIGTTALE